MKVEWLNDELNKARVVVGWFRGRTAIVWRQPMSYGGDRWHFASTGRYIGAFRSGQLNKHRKRAVDAKNRPVEWEPVCALPPARVERQP